MGFDPAGAAVLIEETAGDEMTLTELLEGFEERASRSKLAEMLRTASAVRAGGATGEKGFSAYKDWQRSIEEAMKPKPKKTVFDRLGRAEKPKPKTIWDSLGKE